MSSKRLCQWWKVASPIRRYSRVCLRCSMVGWLISMNKFFIIRPLYSCQLFYRETVYSFEFDFRFAQNWSIARNPIPKGLHFFLKITSYCQSLNNAFEKSSKLHQFFESWPKNLNFCYFHYHFIMIYISLTSSDTHSFLKLFAQFLW